MCPSSNEKRECFDENCKLHHFKGTKRHPQAQSSNSNSSNQQPRSQQSDFLDMRQLIASLRTELLGAIDLRLSASCATTMPQMTAPQLMMQTSTEPGQQPMPAPQMAMQTVNQPQQVPYRPLQPSYQQQPALQQTAVPYPTIRGMAPAAPFPQPSIRGIVPVPTR